MLNWFKEATGKHGSSMLIRQHNKNISRLHKNVCKQIEIQLFAEINLAASFSSN